MDDDDGRSAMWGYIGIMVAFKIATVAVILYYTHTLTSILIILTLHTAWIIGGLCLLGVPATVWYRLVRMRARRAKLLRQEFFEEPKTTSGWSIPTS